MQSKKPKPAPGTVIFAMTIRLKSGRVIRRPNGKPFRFVAK